MQTLQYMRQTPPPCPSAHTVFKAPGNNWNDDFFKASQNKVVRSHETEPVNWRTAKYPPKPSYDLATRLEEVYMTNPQPEPMAKLSLEDKILHFNAYFQETVPEGPETNHIRKVYINFYPVDNTLMVIEPRVQDSGYLGGTLLKRHKVPLSKDSKKAMAETLQRRMGGYSRIATDEGVKQRFVTINELNVGNEIQFYGRTFHIVDCDASTRDFLEALGVNVPEAQPYPDDKYFSEIRSNLSRMEPRRHMTQDDRELKMSFEQAVMGRTLMHHPEQIAQSKRILADDSEVLKFNAIWDDRGNPHGDLRFFDIKFFPCDDSFMVMETVTNNSGRDPARVAVTRRRLPKDAAAMCPDLTFKHRADNVPRSAFYGAADLGLGKTITIHGRKMRMVDTDPFTRSWYLYNMGLDLGAPVDVEMEYKIGPAFAMYKSVPPPPHNGFGEEEDSMGNCNRLVLRAPKKDITKWHKMDGQTLRFSAKLHRPPSSADSDRRFLITFYLGDDTMQVIEQFQHNSGRIAGRLLKRQRVKKFAGEGPKCYYQWDDLYTGAVVNLCSHVYEIIGVDDFTRSFRYHKDRLPAGIDEDTIKCTVESWGLSTEEALSLSLSELLDCAAGESVDPQDVVFDLMKKYNADHGGDVVLREFLATVSGDFQRALEETEDGPDGQMTQAKQERSKLIMSLNAAKVLREAMRVHKLSDQDLFRLMWALPRSRQDNIGSIAENSVNAKINAYQFITACKQTLKMQLEPAQMEAVVDYLFPGSKKTLSLTEFSTLLSKWENYGALPPVRPRSGGSNSS
mmetsp:Transcript_1930/g.3610  ORF Transcript_1930/g.3610 Transcript_1930/m.3610 type:complete len:792 (+) Transcript_1930:55-2430(+)